MSSSVSESLNVPFMETRWDYDFKRSPFSISVHPHPSMLGRAYADYVTKVNPGWSLQLYAAVVLQVGWKSLVILYESEEGLVKLQV